MLPLGLGLPLAIISLIGFVINAYIVLVVVLTKQGYGYIIEASGHILNCIPEGGVTKKANYIYIYNKYLDLIETIIFVLRKKQSQISFLHVYHHVAVIAFPTILLYTNPGGMVTMYGVMNCFVHVIMYMYYLMTNLMAGQRALLNRLKPRITEIQLVSANNILLLHLGLVNALLCILFLVFSVPSIARNDGHSAFGDNTLMCIAHGFLMTTAHPVGLWTICCLNCDRYYAIAAPLHYGAIVNTRKAMFCLAVGWFLALILCIPPFFSVAPFRYNPLLGACVPNFASSASSLWYAIVFTGTTLVVPAVLIIGCNIRVLMIARYHRHRIASAIYEVTLSAQVTITHQRNPFFVPIATPPKIRTRSPLTTVLQLVLTVLLMYCPFYVTILWNSAVASLVSGSVPIDMEASPLVVVIAASLLACSPCVNGLLYGVKSKIMRKTFQNYWRKQKTKSEICQEIQARTPSTCGSRRPSVTTLGIFNRPIPQRRLSETFFEHEKPLMKRIASEISWRPTSLTFADLNESPAPTPNAPRAATIPHTSSCNTLQIPTKTNDDTDLGTTDADHEHFANVKNSFRPVASTHTPTFHSYHSGAAAAAASTKNISLTSATSALLHKMLRIEIREDSSSQHNSLSGDDSLILRSPRILITRAYSENDDIESATLNATAQQQQTVAYTWPSPEKTGVDMSEDEDTAEEDYSRLLAATGSSMSASNSTTLSSVSCVRPFSSMDETQLTGLIDRTTPEQPTDDPYPLISSRPSSKTRPNSSHCDSITTAHGGDEQSQASAETK